MPTIEFNNDQQRSNKSIAALIELNRPVLWLKNLLVFMPLFFVPIADISLSLLLLSFFGFCLASSIVYVINDITDLEEDKLHPQKRFRPLASSRISHLAAISTASLFLIFLAGIIALHPTIGLIISLYLFLSLLYCLDARSRHMLDMGFIAILHQLRVIAGWACLTYFDIQAVLSTLLIGVTAIGVTTSKRMADLEIKSKRAYTPSDKDNLKKIQSFTIGISILLIGYTFTINQTLLSQILNLSILSVLLFSYFNEPGNGRNSNFFNALVKSKAMMAWVILVNTAGLTTIYLAKTLGAGVL